jgi:acetolactate synthase-1/2/3 large subunit
MITDHVQSRLTTDSSVAEGIVDALLSEGVTFLSAYPTTPLIEAAAARQLRPVLCRQERVGVGIADGYSRVTSGHPPGVFAMQYGPGIENAYSGVATCFADSVPVLLLPLGYPEDRQDSPRFHNADRLRGVAKSVERIRAPGETHNVMRRAFSRLKNGRPGPVVVEVPLDVVEQRLGDQVHAHEPVSAARPAGDPDAVEAAVKALLTASTPLILAGQGVLYANATLPLIQLAELLDIPVGTTLEGKSAFPENHDLSLGTGARARPAPFQSAMDEADLVLGVGTSFTDHPLVGGPPIGKTIIHITLDELDLNKDCRADFPVIGDASLVLEAMLACVRDLVPADRLGGHQRRSRVRQLRENWLSDWSHLLMSDETPINPYRVVHEIGAVLDPDTSVLTHDSGSPRDQLTPFYQATVPHGYIGWGKSHALGSGLGLIMGAKLASPEKVCVQMMGDAAFGMVGLDFETAVRNEIPIVLIVLNNQTMACETRHLRLSHERYRTRDIGGGYADIARALGGWAHRVERPDEVRAAIQAAVQASLDGHAALLEILTSPLMTPFSCHVGAESRGSGR